jgi:hypothetical protein
VARNGRNVVATQALRSAVTTYLAVGVKLSPQLSCDAPTSTVAMLPAKGSPCESRKGGVFPRCFIHGSVAPTLRAE